MPDDVDNLKVTLQRIHVIDDGDDLGSGELYFQGSVDTVPVSRSRTFDADSGQDIPLSGAQWEKVVDVRGKASIRLTLRGFDEDVFSDESVGTVDAVISKNGAGVWPEGQFTAMANPAGFRLHYKVEPLLLLNPARPDTAVVCRQHGASATCSTISGVTVRVVKIKATVVSTPPRTLRAAPPAVANAWAAPTDLFFESTKVLPAGPLVFAAADFAMPNALVVIKHEGAVIQLEAETSPPGVDICFQAIRATDDAGAIAGVGLAVPTINNTGNTTATMAVDARGSFFVLAFVDANRNHQRENNEQGIILPVVLVDCSIAADRSTSHPANFEANFDNVAHRVSAANYNSVRMTTGNFAGAATAGMSFDCDVLLVGGGADGQRGLDRVFLGWANNVEQLTHQGTYSDGSVVSLVVADNVPGGGTFLPANPVPNLIPPYWLDTGRFLANGSAAAFHSSLGGENILFTSSNMAAPVVQPLGDLRTVTAVDSPGLSMGHRHPDPAKPAPIHLQQLTTRIVMETRLVAWTNTTGGAPPTPATPNSVGFRTFSVINSLAWIIDGQWRVVPPSAAHPTHRLQPLPGAIAPSLFAMPLGPHSPARTPATDDLEIRPPSALEFLGTNAP
jgi:hypothetical protein